MGSMTPENLLPGALGCTYSPNLPPQSRGCLQPLCILGDTLYGEVGGKNEQLLLQNLYSQHPSEVPEHLSPQCLTQDWTSDLRLKTTESLEVPSCRTPDFPHSSVETMATLTTPYVEPSSQGACRDTYIPWSFQYGK